MTKRRGNGATPAVSVSDVLWPIFDETAVDRIIGAVGVQPQEFEPADQAGTVREFLAAQLNDVARHYLGWTAPPSTKEARDYFASVRDQTADLMEVIRRGAPPSKNGAAPAAGGYESEPLMEPPSPDVVESWTRATPSSVWSAHWDRLLAIQSGLEIAIDANERRSAEERLAKMRAAQHHEQVAMTQALVRLHEAAARGAQLMGERVRSQARHRPDHAQAWFYAELRGIFEAAFQKATATKGGAYYRFARACVLEINSRVAGALPDARGAIQSRVEATLRG